MSSFVTISRLNVNFLKCFCSFPFIIKCIRLGSWLWQKTQLRWVKGKKGDRGSGGFQAGSPAPLLASTFPAEKEREQATLTQEFKNCLGLTLSGPDGVLCPSRLREWNALINSLMDWCRRLGPPGNRCQDRFIVKKKGLKQDWAGGSR